ncbi:acyl-CoA thioesterase [Neglectibacter timonensis]|uniref:acyl-CoA thioesterase n=1 Tax=Neglectibacter timonensis TaxID=1776382 RepID=UPI003996C677
MAGKHVSESYTEQVQILSQSTLNGYNRLFGGQLMQWIDVVAAVVARRHSGCNVTTASVDNLRFEGPAYANDTIVLCGYITYSGRTSMEVCVRTYVEELSGLKRLINVAYLVMVALNAEERPTEVPKLVVESEAEKREWEAACERNAIRKTRRKAAQKELKG